MIDLCIQGTGLKIEDFQKTFLDPWIEDWRCSENFLQSSPGLKIEDFQKTFFNPALDWRLKIFRKLSSIQPWIEDWRFSKNFLRSQSSIFNPGLDWRKFSENLQSSIQGWIEDFFESWPCKALQGFHLCLLIFFCVFSLNITIVYATPS